MMMEHVMQNGLDRSVEEVSGGFQESLESPGDSPCVLLKDGMWFV